MKKRTSRSLASTTPIQARAKKSFSQNFLNNTEAIEKIINIAKLQAGDCVIEIGPGTGALTQHLLSLPIDLVLIEKDFDLFEKLTLWIHHQKPKASVQLVCKDAIEEDFDIYLSKKNTPVKIIANLPYQISSKILQKLLPLYPYVHSMTLMFQEAYALRVIAVPNSKDYSSLSHFVSCYAEAKLCLTIPASDFVPQPKINSSVVHFVMKQQPHPLIDNPLYFSFVQTTFNQRRKTLLNNLKNLFPIDKIEQALIQADLSLACRAQELSSSEFACIFQALSDTK